jgi:arylsulfatase A-like enzyme
VIAAYDGAIAYVDDQLMTLVAELDRRGLSQNTIVIVTSDHGESLGEHGLYGHQSSLYHEQIEVPLIIRWLGKTPAGARVSVPVSLAELPATVMELIGEPQQTLFPGRSLVRAWADPGTVLDWPLPVAELTTELGATIPINPVKSGFHKALISPQWYYIVHEKLETELFDMEKDPQQLHNLAKTPEGRAVVSEFEAHLRQTLARANKDAHPVSPGSVK